MKKIVLLSIIIWLSSLNIINGQESVLIDVYTITEMYKVDAVNNTSKSYEYDFFSNYKMVRMQSKKDNTFAHKVLTLNNENTILIAYGIQIACEGFEEMDEIVNERICYDGPLVGKFFKNNEGYLFVYESLKTPADMEDKSKEFVSFTYVFINGNIIQLYGYKTNSNYDSNNKQVNE